MKPSEALAKAKEIEEKLSNDELRGFPQLIPWIAEALSASEDEIAGKNEQIQALQAELSIAIKTKEMYMKASEDENQRLKDEAEVGWVNRCKEVAKLKEYYMARLAEGRKHEK